jgi:G:T-mismatch repair DNA endonuclease (very short patch repair protein)
LRVSFPFVILPHIECIRFVHGCRRPPHPCPAFSSPLYQVRV